MLCSIIMFKLRTGNFYGWTPNLYQELGDSLAAKYTDKVLYAVISIIQLRCHGERYDFTSDINGY